VSIKAFDALKLDNLHSVPRPVKSYAEAMQRLTTLQARDGGDVHPDGKTLLLTHGGPVERVVIWFHGYTASPRQFAQLGQMCFERGYNVLIPRLPRHGLKERMTAETAHLTAEELGRAADEAVDIACGLGQKVVVGGLSMGGVMAGWAAQQRSEIDLALLMAPAFGVRVVPACLTRLAAGLGRRLPNVFQWWDPRTRDASLKPPVSYPRYSLGGLAEMIRLGFSVQEMERRSQPVARRIYVITNANDMAVNHDLIEQVAAMWRVHGAEIRTYCFSAGLKLDHDFIDPAQPRQRVEVSYPVILSAMEEG
jgi:pimeloyl-ACP methyl ester carboxylesterase